ncbi:uncharacterized protein VTP21DRAFT_333 [Calcarisporiella thermophila]|uniref:uncharacterized protein n=1 Tax=Calcarisporiella thermophila TaxID=911321 RepID=UPI003742941B
MASRIFQHFHRQSWDSRRSLASLALSALLLLYITSLASAAPARTIKFPQVSFYKIENHSITASQQSAPPHFCDCDSPTCRSAPPAVTVHTGDTVTLYFEMSPGLGDCDIWLEDPGARPPHHRVLQEWWHGDCTFANATTTGTTPLIIPARKCEQCLLRFQWELKADNSRKTILERCSNVRII